MIFFTKDLLRFTVTSLNNYCFGKPYHDNIIDCSAIVNDQLSVLALAITQGMGHDGWANVVTLSNIHERSLFTSHLGMETP